MQKLASIALEMSEGEKIDELSFIYRWGVGS